MCLKPEGMSDAEWAEWQAFDDDMFARTRSYGNVQGLISAASRRRMQEQMDRKYRPHLQQEGDVDGA